MQRGSRCAYRLLTALLAAWLASVPGLAAAQSTPVPPCSEVTERRLTLAEYFVRHRPRRVMPPGAEISYSNTGMALAGYLVEAAMAEPFARDAERAIFRPLSMNRSTFEQPVPDEWARDTAAGVPRGARRIVFNPYPAASLSTTVVDMGRFISAHLHDGALDGGARLLSPAVERTMQAPHWRAQPSAPGVALGFFEGVENGRLRDGIRRTCDSSIRGARARLPAEAGPGRLRQILVRDRGRMTVVPVHEIDWIEADAYYVHLHTRTRSHMLRERMSALETQLDPSHFIRTHRSAIVRIDRVREVRAVSRYEHEVLLTSGACAPLSRERRIRLETLLAARRRS